MFSNIIPYITYKQILYDFEVMHPNACGKLMSNWPLYSQKLKKVLELDKKDDSFATMWPKDVELFLMLLKLLPAVVCGKNTLPEGIQTFNKSVDKLIVFNQVNGRLNYELTFLFYVECYVFLLHRLDSHR